MPFLEFPATALFINLTTKYNKVKEKYTSFSPCPYYLSNSVLRENFTRLKKKKMVNQYIYSTVNFHLLPFDGILTPSHFPFYFIENSLRTHFTFNTITFIKQMQQQ